MFVYCYRVLCGNVRRVTASRVGRGPTQRHRTPGRGRRRRSGKGGLGDPHVEVRPLCGYVTRNVGCRVASILPPGSFDDGQR